MSTADLGRGIKYRQDVLALGTDSVLLADFARPVGGRVCDLGCGAGAVMILMALHGGTAEYDGVEIRAFAAGLACENAKSAGLADRMRVTAGDLRCISSLLPGGAFSAVVSNPPYIPIGGGIAPADPDLAAARTEEHCTLRDLCRAAAYLLKDGGKFCVVYPPGRLGELMRVMREHKIEPKRLRLFCARADSAPSLILLEGRYGAKEGIDILPSLFGDGAEYGEITKML